MTDAPDVGLQLTKALIALKRARGPSGVAEMLCRIMASFIHAHAAQDKRAVVLAGMMSDVTDLLVRLEEEAPHETQAEEVKH